MMKKYLMMAGIAALFSGILVAQDSVPEFSCLYKDRASKDYRPVEIKLDLAHKNEYLLMFPSGRFQYLIVANSGTVDLNKNSIEVNYAPRTGLIYSDKAKLEINWRTGKGKFTRKIRDPFNTNYSEGSHKRKAIFKDCKKI